MSLTLETLEQLISFDTVSAKSNLKIIDFIEGFLRGRGARTSRIAGTAAGKCGLFAEIGPQIAGGVLLSAHTDVVPVEGQIWTRAPFILSREGDRLFGRGTTDMKGYIACMLAAADMAARMRLTEPLKLVFSYDEEIGCVGIREMLPKLIPYLGSPRACIVGEPTEMKIAVGHKGKAALRAVCHGQSGHSALAPKFVNALHLAVETVTGLRNVQDWYQKNGAHDPAYDIPYTTLHIGKMSGGMALNIVPDRAVIDFEYRHLAADAPSEIMSRITQVIYDIEARYREIWSLARIEIDRYNTYPGLDGAQNPDAEQLAQRLLKTKQTTKVAFGTEAGFFDGLGIPTIVCGPGSMEGQGHKPDEYLELSQIKACEKMLAGVVETLSMAGH